MFMFQAQYMERTLIFDIVIGSAYCVMPPGANVCSAGPLCSALYLKPTVDCILASWCWVRGTPAGLCT